MREVIVIDRDTKVVELFRPAGGQYLPAAADAEGGRQSDALEVCFSGTPPHVDASLTNRGALCLI